MDMRMNMEDKGEGVRVTKLVNILSDFWECAWSENIHNEVYKDKNLISIL